MMSITGILKDEYQPVLEDSQSVRVGFLELLQPLVISVLAQLIRATEHTPRG